MFQNISGGEFEIQIANDFQLDPKNYLKGLQTDI